MASKASRVEDTVDNQLIDNLVLDVEMTERTRNNQSMASGCQMRLAIDLMRIYRDMEKDQYYWREFVKVGESYDRLLCTVTLKLPAHKLTNKIVLSLSEKLNYSVTTDKESGLTTLTK